MAPVGREEQERPVKGGAYFHGYWHYPLHRAMRFLRGTLQPAWFYGFAIGNLGLGLIWKARDEATLAYRTAVGGTSTMPWEAAELDGWDVRSLYHSRQGGQRRLFVLMARGSACIRAEGTDEALVWAQLREQARRPHRATV